MYLYSFIFVDSSCAVLISVECATDNVGECVVFPEVLSRDEVIGISDVSSYYLVVNDDVCLTVGCCEETKAVDMEVVGHSSRTTVIVVPGF